MEVTYKEEYSPKQDSQVSIQMVEVVYSNETKPLAIEKFSCIHGQFGTYQLKGVVETQDISYDEKVDVHICFNHGNWHVLHAIFQHGNQINGKELWTFESPKFILLPSSKQQPEQHQEKHPYFQLAICCRTTNQIHWDNNNGKNHKIAFIDNSNQTTGKTYRVELNT